MSKVVSIMEEQVAVPERHINGLKQLAPGADDHAEVCGDDAPKKKKAKKGPDPNRPKKKKKKKIFFSLEDFTLEDGWHEGLEVSTAPITTDHGHAQNCMGFAFGVRRCLQPPPTATLKEAKGWFEKKLELGGNVHIYFWPSILGEPTKDFHWAIMDADGKRIHDKPGLCPSREHATLEALQSQLKIEGYNIETCLEGWCTHYVPKKDDAPEEDMPKKDISEEDMPNNDDAFEISEEGNSAYLSTLLKQKET